MVEVKSTLQERVISLGRLTYLGSLIVGLVFVIAGVVFLGCSFLPGFTDVDLSFIFRFIGIMLLSFTPIFLYGYFYGKNLVNAAKARHVNKLLILFFMWAVPDLLFFVGMLMIVIFLHAYQFLVLLFGFAIDAWRLRRFWRFIQECRQLRSSIIF